MFQALHAGVYALVVEADNHLLINRSFPFLLQFNNTSSSPCYVIPWQRVIRKREQFSRHLSIDSI